MEQFSALPFAVRLPAMFLLGTVVGAVVNWMSYRWAWHPRPISPWMVPDPLAPKRRWWDRLPVLGWLGLRREAAVHGWGFWIRPMAVELVCGVGCAALYWWEVGSAGLLPDFLPPLSSQVLTVLHLQFAAHIILGALLLAASLIDIDEKLIPDEITICGTLVGLLLAAACPWSLLPDVQYGDNGQVQLNFLQLASPCAWPDILAGAPQLFSLAIALGCWWFWCLALLPRTWYDRHGWRRAMVLCWARMRCEPATYRLLRMAVVGSLAVLIVWLRNGEMWQGLLSSLMGVAVGGALIWSVRIIASAALGREAMGFGDVTLMAMIGAYLGWQSTLIIFFLAPLAGLAIGLIRLLLIRDREVPYGPFLCLATLFLIVAWEKIWNFTRDIFAIVWLVAAVMFVCLLLMAGMLSLWRMVLRIFRRF